MFFLFTEQKKMLLSDFWGPPLGANQVKSVSAYMPWVKCELRGGLW